MNKFSILLALIALGLPWSLSAQTIKDYIHNDWPDNRYQVHGDGTVTDTVTGLMWMQCSLGQDPDDNCSGSTSSHNWQQALEAAADSTFANYSDWRLPNIKEFSSLAALDRHSPAINSTIFPNTPSYMYWSASPEVSDYDYYARVFDLQSGGDYIGYIGVSSTSRVNSHSIRLVRSSQ